MFYGEVLLIVPKLSPLPVPFFIWSSELCKRTAIEPDGFQKVDQTRQSTSTTSVMMRIENFQNHVFILFSQTKRQASNIVS